MTEAEKALAMQFKPVTIRDDLMFGTVMADPKYCKPFLETILGVKIKKIEYLERQKTIDITPRAKSVRMDVYVEDDEHTIYDVEMQTGKKDNLAKRSRYYHGLIDLNSLLKGEDYSKLKKSLVIFVCIFDPFNFGQYVYSYEYQTELFDGSHHFLGDGTRTIYVNAKGYRENVSDEFKALMRYITDGETSDSYTKALDEKVSLVNNNEEWKVSYMTWAIKLADERREAREEGREEGREKERIQSIKSLMDNMKWTAEQAMGALNIPQTEWAGYLLKLR